MDHYLTIQKWTPNFHIERAKVKSTAVRIRLLGLPLEYFHESILVSVEKLVGKPIKVDTNTALAMRGKFARIYVVVDFGTSVADCLAFMGKGWVVEICHILQEGNHCADHLVVLA
ncbi:hypothetical protein GOBAR_DD29718 [Gossypium barbadense]|nr:hypothetical protein GOBAR_DD29718 [Gossypium barbadense]